MLVSGTQIKAQALKFSNEIKIQDLQLKFTDGWFRHFKGRHAMGYIIKRPMVKQSLLEIHVLNQTLDASFHL